jgi:glutamate dehydrogenase (NAD(P)+)
VIVSYYEWLQNNRHEHWPESEVNQRLRDTIKLNYNYLLDVAADRPRVAPNYNSKMYTVGRRVSTRTAAMVLALQRLDAHYKLEGFSH